MNDLIDYDICILDIRDKSTWLNKITRYTKDHVVYCYEYASSPPFPNHPYKTTYRDISNLIFNKNLKYGEMLNL